MRRIGLAVVLALSASLLAVPILVEAQSPSRMWRVGWLEGCGPSPQRPHFDIFWVRLAGQGYIEGKNLILEQRFADCRYDRMAGLVNDLVPGPGAVLVSLG